MKNLYKNKSVIDGLDSVQYTGYQFCQLIEEADQTVPTKRTPEQNRVDLTEGVPVYTFMVNPESIQWTLPIEYQETRIPYTSINQVNFVSGGNITMTLPDLILDAYFEKKSIEILLNRLRDLRNPTEKTGLKSHPKRLYFKWGAYKFGACVLTNIQTNITRVINGKPSKARVTLTLKEVPQKSQIRAYDTAKTVISAQTSKTPGVISSAPGNNTSVTPGNLKKPLTDNQKSTALRAALKYLEVRRTLLPRRTQEILSQPNSTIKVNKDTGAVDLVNADGSTIINLGTYNGDRFIPAI